MSKSRLVLVCCLLLAACGSPPKPLLMAADDLNAPSNQQALRTISSKDICWRVAFSRAVGEFSKSAGLERTSLVEMNPFFERVTSTLYERQAMEEMLLLGYQGEGFASAKSDITKTCYSSDSEGLETSYLFIRKSVKDWLRK